MLRKIIIILQSHYRRRKSKLIYKERRREYYNVKSSQLELEKYKNEITPGQIGEA